MNYIDILLAIIILSSITTGWYRGFVLGVLDLIRWIGSILLAFRFYPYLADWLKRHVSWSEVWIPPLSFFVVAIVAGMLLQYLGLLLLKQLPHTIHSRKANQALGTVPGFFSGLIMAAIVAVLLLAIPLPESIEAKVQDSRIVNRLATYTDQVEMKLAPVFEEAAQRTLNRFAIEPTSNEFYELPFKVANATPRPDLEEKMLELLNEERIAEGLKPLQADTALRSVARRHSADMFRRGYFSHHSPEGDDASGRIREAGIRFRAAGENLALAPTITIAHEGLMNSPGHRANILQRRFGRVGIGVMEGKGRGLMVTQNFRN